MKEKKSKKLIITAAAAGAVLMLLCRFIPDVTWITAASNLLWPMCFVYAFRKSEGRLEPVLCIAFLAMGFIIRFYGFLGSVLENSLVLIISALCISLSFMADRFVMMRHPSAAAVLVFPVIWMGIYSLFSMLGLGTQFRLDYLMYGCKNLIQCVSIIGGEGLSFLILLMASALVYFFNIFGSIKGKLGVAACILVAAVICICGAVRRSSLEALDSDDSLSSVNAAYATGPYIGDFCTSELTDTEEAFECLRNSVKTAAEGNAEILVFCEEAFCLKKADCKSLAAEASALAEKYGIEIILCMEVNPDSGSSEKAQNMVLILDDSGKEIGRYIKYNLVPIIESGDYERGNGKIPYFTSGKSNISSACVICYDSNFPAYISSISDDTDILYLPSWDWNYVTVYHKMLTEILAVENGLTVLKPTYDGISLAADPLGRIIKTSNTDDTGFGKVEFVSIKSYNITTVYGVIGPYLHWLWIAFAAACCVFLVVKKQKGQNGRFE